MSWDRNRIFELLLEAGQIAQWSKSDLRLEYKRDGSMVTRADQEIESFFSSRLEDPSNGIHLIGEETVSEKGEGYIQRALSEISYVVDPIDGTSTYAHGLPNWGISVGYMENGHLTDGAVYLPDYGEVILSEGKKILEGRREGASWSWRELPPPSREPGTTGLVGITQEVAKGRKVPLRNPVQVLGAAVVPLVGLVQNRFLAYLGSVKLWDVAGALPLVLRCNFSVTIREGKEVRKVGPRVHNHAYHLEPESRSRWWLRSDLLVCYPQDEKEMRAALMENDD